MVNPEKVHGLLRNLQSALEQLRQIAQMDQRLYVQDGLASGAAKYYLQMSIEACINIGNHAHTPIPYPLLPHWSN
jgi:uncharacterized protein YutE (UPF0331/DUF86 family)